MDDVLDPTSQPKPVVSQDPQDNDAGNSDEDEDIPDWTKFVYVVTPFGSILPKAN